MWLVKLTDNWADEMDIEGFSIMSTGQFTLWAKTVEEVAKKIDEGRSFEWYFGTNEWIDWKNGGLINKNYYDNGEEVSVWEIYDCYNHDANGRLVQFFIRTTKCFL